MKELSNLPPLPEKVQIVNQKQYEKHKEYLGSTVRYNGHTVFEINCTTGEIKPAEFKEERIEIVPEVNLLFGKTGGTTTRLVRDIGVKQNCVYIPALNKKSALKKFMVYLAKSKSR